MQIYVLGFLFDLEGKQVVLIQKNRPEWQAGFYNGVGGKVEKNESHKEAMQREFLEETGLKVSRSDWRRAGKIIAEDYIIHVFTAKHRFYNLAKTQESEPVLIAKLDLLKELPVLQNVPWLVNICLDDWMQDFTVHV